MQQETHETGSNDGVANPDVPSSPELLQPSELGEVDISVELLGRLVRSCHGGVEDHGGKGQKPGTMTGVTLLNSKNELHTIAHGVTEYPIRVDYVIVPLDSYLGPLRLDSNSTAVCRLVVLPQIVLSL